MNRAGDRDSGKESYASSSKYITDSQPVGKRPDQRKRSGEIAENAVAEWMLEQGYKIAERNWRCRQGELDLIAWDNGRLVVVEVRSARAGSRFGTALEALHSRKQQKVRLVASVYVQQKGWSGNIRFDAAAVTLDYSGQRVEDIVYVRQAF
ncbi:YraN family protein [Paenibacillus pasadenensis]|uniref:YraN family protein n=1 Tax=Paenibacillus pasadenensis TaxID=217090 RepID=UPI00203BB12A|nr:YraN family protein [Paenibacillus pasadenensis]MCM3746026.1 YraN family protein [Paenibacillus pasadenensis]